MDAMQHSLLRLLERAFVVVALVLMSGAVIPLLDTAGTMHMDDVEAGHRALQVAMAAVYAVTLVLAMGHVGAILGLCRRNLPILALTAWVVASVAWSVNPEVTLRRSIALGGTVFLGFYLAARFPPRQYLALLSTALGLAALMSVGFVLLAPQYGLHPEWADAGAWRGAFNHKNVLAQVMVLAAVVFLLRSLDRDQPHRWVWQLGLIVALALVVLSESRTGWLLMALMLVAVPSLWLMRAHLSIVAPAALLLGVLLVGIAGWAATSAEQVLGAMGRDVTLTGRTTLWMVAAEAGMERPWMGAGFRAFWLGPAGASGEVWWVLGWAPTTGHNGFLDVWLELGWVGVGLFGLAVAHYLWRALLWLRQSTSPALGIWPMCFALYLLAYSMPAGLILNQNHIAWLTFVYLSVVIAKAPHEAEVTDERATVPLSHGLALGGRW